MQCSYHSSLLELSERYGALFVLIHPVWQHAVYQTALYMENHTGGKPHLGSQGLHYSNTNYCSHHCSLAHDSKSALVAVSGCYPTAGLLTAVHCSRMDVGNSR